MISRREFGLLPVLVTGWGCGSQGDRVVVGSKNFTENLLLGEVLAQQIEARAGLTVDRKLNLGGTFLCHKALVAGEIDLYPEYSGTALTAVLHRPADGDPERVLATVSQAYREEFGVEWLPPLGFNNTYALVVRPEDAERHNLQAISDLKRVESSFKIGFGFEFFERQDGYPALIEKYGLQFGPRPKTMDLNLVYRALQGGEIDLAVGNSTDGLIAAMGLQILDDDQRFFPPYDAAPVARRETLERYAGLREALAELAGQLSEEDMQRYNYLIDGEHRPIEEVAREILTIKGLLAAR
jgi:glycine betaine/choline ABC-type transport system substrate-binding protein